MNSFDTTNIQTMLAEQNAVNAKIRLAAQRRRKIVSRIQYAAIALVIVGTVIEKKNKNTNDNED